MQDNHLAQKVVATRLLITNSIIAHELEHVWQMMKKHMGEDKPGTEIEAYVKQAMLLEFLPAYEKERTKLFKKIK